MNKLLVVFVLFLAMNTTQSQSTTKLSITESSEFKDEVKAEGALAFYTSEEGATGIIRKGKKHFLLDVFDNNLNKVKSILVESDKKERFVGFVNFKNQIKFFTVYSPKKKERIVYGHTFNIKEKTHTKTKLFEKTIEKSGSLFSGTNKRQTSVAISPNGEYIAMATDNIKKNSNSYLIHVFNAETLELLYKKSYQEDTEKFFEPNDLAIDNDANTYALGKLYKKGRAQKKKGEANYQFVLNKISKDAIADVAIDLGELHIASLVINNNSDQLQLLGFYSEERAGRIKGGCNFILDNKTLAITKQNQVKLPIEVYKDLYGYRKAERKKKKELKSFYVDYVIEDSIGNTYLLAEEFYVTQQYVSTGNGIGYWVTTYHYDDILILKFNANGEVDWGRSIFKRASSPSYNAFLKDDKLHVMINSGKNLLEKKDGRTKVSKGWFESSALYDIVYSIDGNVSYDKVQNNKGNTYYLPYYGTYENGKFVMMSSGRKKKQFMILE